MASTLDRNKVLQMLRNSTRDRNGHVPGQGASQDNVTLVHRSDMIGTPFHVDEVRFIETTRNGQPTAILYVTPLNEDGTTGEQVKFWAGAYIYNQVKTDNRNAISQAEFDTRPFTCFENPDIKTRSKSDVPILLDYWPHVDEESDEEPEEDSNEEIDEESDEEPEEDSDEEPQTPSSVFRSVAAAQQMAKHKAAALSQFNKKMAAQPQPKPKMPTAPTKKVAATLPTKKPAPVATAVKVQDIGNGEFTRGRGRPPTGAVYFSKKTGRYLDANKKPIVK